MPEPSAIAIKFTDVNYVTMKGFFDALGTRLVERLWNDVVSYRAINAKTTRLRTAKQLPFSLTYTEALKNRFAAFSAKLLSAKEEYDRFASLSEEKERLDRALIYNALKNAADMEKILITEPTARAMVSGMYSGSIETHLPLLGYRDFLRQSIATDFKSCDTFFGSLYSAMSGTEELVTFYRLDDESLTKGRAGEYAKFNDIESLMDNLEGFVSLDPLDAMLKPFLAMYFVSYVAPFAAHNDLLGVALAKKMLSLGPLGEFAFLLPLETLPLHNARYDELFLESAKTGDFTYVMLYWMESLSYSLDAAMNEWTRLRTEAMKREFRSEPHEEAPAAPAPELTEVVATEEPLPPVEVIAPKAEEAKAVAVEETTFAPVEPEPVRVAPEQKEEPNPVVAPAKEAAPVEEVPILEALPIDEKALYAPKVSLKDKDVKMAARYIIETHPDINKQQALFFASHCTLGRYYTIQDYKKTMKVAYETARTSMDRLAASKLYKKLRIKNKYVYTPRKPGEKE